MAEKVFTNSAEFQYHKGGWGGIRLEVVGRWGVSYLFRKNLELLDKTDSADRVNHTLRGQIFGYFIYPLPLRGLCDKMVILRTPPHKCPRGLWMTTD